jgi:hypothetical protein
MERRTGERGGCVNKRLTGAFANPQPVINLRQNYCMSNLVDSETTGFDRCSSLKINGTITKKKVNIAAAG